MSTRRRFVKRKKGSKVDQALRLAKANKKFLRKQTDVDVTTVSVAKAAMNATPVITLIGIINREGHRVTLKSVQLQGLVLQNLTSALVDEYRVDLVLDRMPQGALATATDIYGAANPEIYDFKNFGNKSRFRILRTFRGLLFEAAIGPGQFLDAYVKLNLVQETDTVNNFTIGALLKNAVYVVFWTTATANQPTFEAEIRMVDLDT